MPQLLKKALKISAEVDLHAVSCPGVWLPGRGRCSLSLCLLGFHTRTNFMPPTFPMLFHEKFKFDRTFLGVRSLTALELVLEKETAYFELVQEESSGDTVLAVFESSVRDLLFPSPVHTLSYSGMDLDLLMEPTRDFPGILSPKIEVGTRSNVRETRSPLHDCEGDTVSFGHAGDTTTKAVYRPTGAPEEGAGGHRGVGGVLNTGETDAEDKAKEAPASPVRGGLGLASRHRSRSTGNLAEVGRASISSRYGRQRPRSAGTGRGRTRRARDDVGHDARVTAVDPDQCPHCEGSHSPHSCTTCRTYRAYFAERRAGGAAPHWDKVLRQPAAPPQHGRRRKRYLADDLGWRTNRPSATPRRPSSAPPAPSPSRPHHSEEGGDGGEEVQGGEGSGEEEGISGGEDEEQGEASRGLSLAPRTSLGRLDRDPLLDWRLRRYCRDCDRHDCYLCCSPHDYAPWRTQDKSRQCYELPSDVTARGRSPYYGYRGVDWLGDPYCWPYSDVTRLSSKLPYRYRRPLSLWDYGV